MAICRQCKGMCTALHENNTLTDTEPVRREMLAEQVLCSVGGYASRVQVYVTCFHLLRMNTKLTENGIRNLPKGKICRARV